MKTRSYIALCISSTLALIACSKGETSGAPAAASSTEAVAAATVDMGQAQTIFNERCSACHGADGRGSGPAAAALTPKPRNYTDKAWQSAVTDAQLRKTIVFGGAAVGKSPMMPASPDLDEKPEVVEGLVKIVRKYGQ